MAKNFASDYQSRTNAGRRDETRGKSDEDESLFSDFGFYSTSPSVKQFPIKGKSDCRRFDANSVEKRILGL